MRLYTNPATRQGISRIASSSLFGWLQVKLPDVCLAIGLIAMEKCRWCPYVLGSLERAYLTLAFLWNVVGNRDYHQPNGPSALPYKWTSANFICRITRLHSQMEIAGVIESSQNDSSRTLDS